MRGGEVVELISDLGGGKTTFVRGLVQGFGSRDRVASPTFTLSKVYKHGAKQIQHYDFYRLEQAGLAAYELHDALGDPDIIVVIEWGEVVEHVLPKTRVTVKLDRVADESRVITCTYPDNMSYLFADVEQG